MTEPEAAMITRLRASLHAAGIRAAEEDIAGLIARGFLVPPAQFEALAANAPRDAVPDYLAAPQLAVVPAAPAGSPPDLPARPGSLLEAAGRLKRREVSAVELTQQALDRVAERDEQLNAFQLVLADEALHAAHVAEDEIAQGNYRGPLHGIPVAVKDLLAMRGTITAAGSSILATNLTSSDSAAVERLRAAGAIIVGKTRMSEFAYAPGSINAHYGPTANPHNLAYDTGGSSSGSAAAVADGAVFAALGSDTGGSIRIPAALCGIVGLKPTFGRLSLHGAVTLAWSLDHLGPLTRTVADAAVVLAALAGPDERDPRVRPAPLPDLVALLAAGAAGARGLRVGVLRSDDGGAPLGTPDVLAAWQSGLDRLAAAGARLIETTLPRLNALRAVNGAVLAAEALAYHLPTLRERPGEYGEFLRQRLYAAFAYEREAFVRAQQLRSTLRQACQAIWQHVDLLCLPTVPTAAPLLGVPATTPNTGPFNLLGWPAISMPCGSDAAGLPVGLQLVGRPWNEATVLRAALALEE